MTELVYGGEDEWLDPELNRLSEITEITKVSKD